MQIKLCFISFHKPLRGLQNLLLQLNALPRSNTKLKQKLSSQLQMYQPEHSGSIRHFFENKSIIIKPVILS